MSVRITTLSENTAGRGGLLAEWGLSILVETDEASVLLDTGKSISTGYNADTMGINLSRVDKIVLSHGHSDHTGGLSEVLRKMRKEPEIIAHPDIWGAKYKHQEGQADKYNGIPFQYRELVSLGAVFNLTTKPVRITDNITTTGEIPMINDFEKIASTLFVQEDGKLQPDQILDDQALIINTEAGLVIILGCAHRGMINTIEHARQLTGVTKVHAVIGGAHLIDTSEERIWLTIAALKDLNVQRMGLCHCTGLSAIAILANEFGDRFFFNTTGTSIELP